MTPAPRDPRRSDEPRAISRAEHDEAPEPRLGSVQAIIILASLVTFVVAGLAIPAGDAGEFESGGRPMVAASIAVAAFVVAVVTFALGALRSPRR